MKRSRNAFTLVELLVVMSLIAILATMMIAFFPSVTTSAREARAASLLQGWLNIAKQRALRDGTPTGVRLVIQPLPAWSGAQSYNLRDTVSNPLPGGDGLNYMCIQANTNTKPPNATFWALYTNVVECQYIAQPDDFSVGKVYHTTVNIQSVSPAASPGGVIVTTTAAHGLSLGDLAGIAGVSVAGYNGSFVVANPMTATTFQYFTSATGLSNVSNSGTVSPLKEVNFETDLTNGYSSQPLWAVQQNDYLEVNGTGLMHCIPYLSSSTKAIVSPPLPNAILQPRKAYYRIIRSPRVAGDEILKLPDSTFIDIGTNINAGNTLPPTPPGLGSGYVDILFGPSGAVISRGVTTDKIHLWVRTPNADFPLDAFRGDPTLISIFVRTGAIGAYQPDPQLTGGTPYSFVR